MKDHINPADLAERKAYMDQSMKLLDALTAKTRDLQPELINPTYMNISRIVFVIVFLIACIAVFFNYTSQSVWELIFNGVTYAVTLWGGFDLFVKYCLSWYKCRTTRDEILN